MNGSTSMRIQAAQFEQERASSKLEGVRGNGVKGTQADGEIEGSLLEMVASCS